MNEFSPGSPVQPSPNATDAPVRVKPYGGERGLGFTILLIGISLWILILVSIVGAFYAVLLGAFFLIAHLSLIAHIRGSAVKLGPSQMPGLHERVVRLAKRLGFNKVPDAYLQESGGKLNAFATRFMGANFLVLYADLVNACGDNEDALDFIIAHELGHIHRGHLKWHWLKAPALFIPFLGSAYSRACEFTCDRYGFLASKDKNKGLLGLALLAVGPQHVASLNLKAFVAQEQDMNTVMMRLGSWLASHPPLAVRIAMLHPRLRPENRPSGLGGTVGALLIASLLLVVPVGGMGWLGVKVVEDITAEAQKKLGAKVSSHSMQREDFPTEDDITLSPEETE